MEVPKEADENVRVQTPQTGSWNAVSLWCWMMDKWQSFSERKNWQCLFKTIKYLIFNSVIKFMGLYSGKNHSSSCPTVIISNISSLEKPHMVFLHPYHTSCWRMSSFSLTPGRRRGGRRDLPSAFLRGAKCLPSSYAAPHSPPWTPTLVVFFSRTLI